MTYKINFARSTKKDFKRINRQDAIRIVTAISLLADNPRPRGVKKMSGQDAWRIRVGEYRVVYDIHDNVITILILKIAHRKDVYR